ncbi:agmatine deiminase family protein [Streptomyces sp. NPDC089795]|uniref:agmatine deiminase family protein n=1 Tax=Streptomyces sp. NPDC089795 TaxID=3155297 RepID=UPI003431A4F3
MRDFGPTFVVAPGAVAGVDTNFNGWGKAGTSYAQPSPTTRRRPARCSPSTR